MDLSIIIPVFNVEKYLEKCLNSILECNPVNTEIILIIRASKDHSNDICAAYQKKCSNIIILEQKATGLSDARNCGLEIAKGDYVIFIDSDDYVNPKYFSKLLYYIKIACDENKIFDIFISDFYRVDEHGNLITSINQIEETVEPINQYSYLEHFFKQKECFWNVWRYVYNRDFLKKNELYFKEGYLSEDIDYSVQALLKAKEIVFYHNPYYCYRVGRSDSLMGVVNYKRVHDTVTIIENNMDAILSNDTFAYGELMAKKLRFEFILNMATIYEVPEKDRKRTLILFTDAKSILGNKQDKTAKMIYVAIKVFGLPFIAFLLFCLKRIKRYFKSIKAKTFGRRKLIK